MIGLSVTIGVLAVAFLALTVLFTKAHFLLPLLSVSKIHGIDETFPDQ